MHRSPINNTTPETTIYMQRPIRGERERKKEKDGGGKLKLFRQSIVK